MCPREGHSGQWQKGGLRSGAWQNCKKEQSVKEIRKAYTNKIDGALCRYDAEM